MILDVTTCYWFVSSMILSVDWFCIVSFSFMYINYVSGCNCNQLKNRFFFYFCLTFKIIIYDNQFVCTSFYNCPLKQTLSVTFTSSSLYIFFDSFWVSRIRMENNNISLIICFCFQYDRHKMFASQFSFKKEHFVLNFLFISLHLLRRHEDLILG